METSPLQQTLDDGDIVATTAGSAADEDLGLDD